MATSYTSLLGLALPVTGELSGTWGDTVNNSITSLLDTAVAGTTTLSTDVDVTLTTTTGASNQARQAIILCSGARTAQRTITAPAQSKSYFIVNNTTGGFGVKIVGVGPTTGVVIPNGFRALVVWDGTDFYLVALLDASSVASVAYGGTGASSITSGALVKGNGTSAFSAASAADIVSAIGSTAVTNATNATNLTGTTQSTAINWSGTQRPSTGTASVSTTSTYSFAGGAQVTTVTVTNAITVTMGAPSGLVAGAYYTLLLTAGDTSARTYAWNSAWKFPAATSPLTSGTTTSGASDIITFVALSSTTAAYVGHQADVR